MHITPGAVGILEPEARRIAMVFATPAGFASYGTGPATAIDLTGADLRLLNAGTAPLLLDHVRTIEAIAGVVEAAWLEPGRAMAVARITLATARARDAWALLQDGALQACSMGFHHSEPEDLPAGSPIIRRWRPFEISLVPLPAVQGAGLHREILPAELDGIARAASAARRSALRDALQIEQCEQAARLALLAAPQVAARLGLDPTTLAGELDAAIAALAEPSRGSGAGLLRE